MAKDRRQRTAPDDLTESLFADRNKLYGAYMLRRTYNRRLKLALLCTLIGFILLLISPSVVEFFKGEEEFKFNGMIVNVEMDEAGGLEEAEELPPPPAVQADAAQPEDIPPKLTDSVITAKKESDKKPADSSQTASNTDKKGGDEGGKPDGGSGNGKGQTADGQGDGKNTTRVTKKATLLNERELLIELRKFKEATIKNHRDDNFSVSCVVSAEGTPDSCWVSSSMGYPEINREGLRLAKMARFDPAIQNDHPVATYAIIKLPFIPPPRR